MKNLLTTILAATISFGGATAIQQSNQYDMEQEIQRLHAIVTHNRASIYEGAAISSEDHYNTLVMMGRMWETLYNSKLFNRELTLDIRENHAAAREMLTTESKYMEGTANLYEKQRREALKRSSQYRRDHDQEVWSFEDEKEDEI